MSCSEVSAATPLDIMPIDRAEIAVKPYAWKFAADQRAEIDRHFADRQRGERSLWNGRVLLLSRCAIDHGVIRGDCFETDYASFLAWRDWDFPDPNVLNIFAAAALRSADGAYLVGEMAPHTANAGCIYFPCGTPDPNDIIIGTLDLAGSVGRELLEETGLTINTLAAEPGWRAVRDHGSLAVIKKLTASEKAEALRARILHNLAAEPRPEFSDIRIVRTPADLDARMPRFVVTFLEQAWRERP
jgi:8-oxo-dGTP pyrophosphatase MutT (NUDIX family)